MLGFCIALAIIPEWYAVSEEDTVFKGDLVFKDGLIVNGVTD